jgi:transcriptional regulator with XRE-family HTH domain
MGTMRLQELREARQLTQKEVSDATGIPREKISKYESGKITPALDTVIVLADYFAVSIDFLVGASSQETEEVYRMLLKEYPQIPKKKRQDFVSIMKQVSQALCN